jgi:hypothetical protein
MGRPRTWSDGDLAVAVATATTWTGVIRLLGVSLGPRAIRSAQGHAMRLGLDVTHLPPTARPPSEAAPETPVARPDPTPAQLAAQAAAARTWTELIIGLGAIPSGHRYRWVRALAAEYGTDVSHFRGRGWNTSGLTRGTAKKDPAVSGPGELA